MLPIRNLIKTRPGRHLVLPLIALLLLSILATLTPTKTAIGRFNTFLTDPYFLFDHPTIDSNLVIVDIDDATVRNFSSFGDSLVRASGMPKRGLLAQLISKIDSLEPAVILVDLLMVQEESEDDSAIVETARLASVVHCFGFRNVEEESRHPARDTTLARRAIGRSGDFQLDFFFGYDLEKPFTALREAAANLGDATVLKDPADETVRRFPIAIDYNQAILPSIALVALSKYLDARQEWTPELTLHVNEDRTLRIPLDDNGIGVMRFLHPADLRHPQRIPFWRALRAKSRALTFLKGKIVVIGSSASVGSSVVSAPMQMAAARRQGDFYRTPISQNYPGMFIHASIINSVLQQSFVHTDSWHGYLLAGVCALLVGMFSFRLALLSWKGWLILAVAGLIILNLVGVAVFLAGLLLNLALVNVTMGLTLSAVLVSHKLWPMRNRVFISYSRHDRRWAEELKTLLAPAVRRGRVSVYLDTEQGPGVLWQKELTKALRTTKVAVLLVSPDYLASDFIMTQELPHFLRAAEQKQLTILWVLLRRSLYEETPLSELQAVIAPSMPLEELPNEEQDKALVALSKEILRALSD